MDYDHPNHKVFADLRNQVQAMPRRDVDEHRKYRIASRAINDLVGRTHGENRAPSDDEIVAARAVVNGGGI